MGEGMDGWFREKREELIISKQFGDYIPSSFFGAADGVYRTYPARQSEDCSWYDPRKRKWFVAASSGPKDVIVVLDASGSMSFGLPPNTRMELAKSAAKEVLSRLTIADYFTVVRFSKTAENLMESISDRSGNANGGGLVRGTEENILLASDIIDGIQPDGSTNFIGAFDTVLQAIQDAANRESTSGCNTAVLFLTDGTMDKCKPRNACSEADHEANLFSTVTDVAATGAKVFTYSLGDSADTTLVKDMACRSGGLWSAIPDGEDLDGYMGNYYKLFATGLGSESNSDFAAWVEPYLYDDG